MLPHTEIRPSGWKILHEGIRYDERDPAVSVEAKKVRTTQNDPRTLGYRVELLQPPSSSPACSAEVFDPGSSTWLRHPLVTTIQTGHAVWLEPGPSCSTPSRVRSSLAIDEIGYPSYHTHAADLLFQVISRRYEQRWIVVTTNLLFKQWDTVFPNASVPSPSSTA